MISDEFFFCRKVELISLNLVVQEAAKVCNVTYVYLFIIYVTLRNKYKYDVNSKLFTNIYNNIRSNLKRKQNF